MRLSRKYIRSGSDVCRLDIGSKSLSSKYAIDVVNVGDCNGSSISKSTLSDLLLVFLDWWHSRMFFIDAVGWCLTPLLLFETSSSDTRLARDVVDIHGEEKLNIWVGDVWACWSSILLTNWDVALSGIGGVRSRRLIKVFVWSNILKRKTQLLTLKSVKWIIVCS